MLVTNFSNAPLVIVVLELDGPTIDKPLPSVIPVASICIIVPVATLFAVTTTGLSAAAEVVSRCNNLPVDSAVLPITSIAVPLERLSIFISIALPIVMLVASNLKTPSVPSLPPSIPVVNAIKEPLVIPLPELI